jgi:hypothetical protein
VRGVVRIGAVLIALMVSGCSSSPPPMRPGDLFREYARSISVKNDRIVNFGTSGDRLANFAAHYTADQLETALLSAYPCARPGERVGLDPVMPATGSRQCAADEAVVKAADAFAGPGAKVYGRSIVVKHRDASLELVWLYIARKPDNSAVLIDAKGGTYGPDLDDFRQNNSVLEFSDLILTPRNITSVPGEGEIVVVSGRTFPIWQLWLVGGIGAVVVLAAGFGIARRLTARRRDPDAG